jgi:hypothetical protein
MNATTRTGHTLNKMHTEKIKAYMHLCLDLCEHHYAGEVNCTTLGEDAADEFRGFNLPDDFYFELAFEVSQEWENGDYDD